MIIDLTHTIAPEMPVYPGTPAPALAPVCTMERNGFRETRLDMASHTGTHMDAPAHILPQGTSLDQLPVSQFCGRAVVLDVSGFAPGESITAEWLKEQNGPANPADFVLFYTGWGKKWGSEAYLEDAYPVLDEEAARYLVSCGLKGIGIDTLSIDRLADNHLPIHKVLLSGGLVIVENLSLKRINNRKDIKFFALPLKYAAADGAPVRAIAELSDLPEKEMETT